jgi:hypothetical protein
MFEVLTEVTRNITVSWGVTPCSLVKCSDISRVSDAFSETSIHLYPTTRRYIQENNNLKMRVCYWILCHYIIPVVRRLVLIFWTTTPHSV